MDLNHPYFYDIFVFTLLTVKNFRPDIYAKNHFSKYFQAQFALVSDYFLAVS